MFGQYSSGYVGKRTKRDMVEDVTRTLGGVAPENARKVANNTLEYVDPRNGDRVIRLHVTDILRFSTGDRPTVTLTTGGWKSVTTKDRLHGFLPHDFRVGSVKGAWQVATPAGLYPYADGIAFYVDTGEPLPGTVPAAEAEALKLATDKRMIARYIKKLTTEGWADPAGDPWVVPNERGLFGEREVRNWLGEAGTGSDGTPYVTRQLFIQAMRVAGISEAGIGMWVSDAERRGHANKYQAGKVRRFLMKCLGHVA